MMVVMLKQVLRSAQQGRDTQAILLQVILIETEGDENKAMKEATIEYNQAVQKDPNHGRPHIYCFMALVESLVKRKETVGARNAKMLKDFETKLMTKDIEEKADLIKYCRVDRLYRCDQRKLMMCVQDEAISAVVSALVQLGGVRKQGRAPASWLERELQLYLQSLEM